MSPFPKVAEYSASRNQRPNLSSGNLGEKEKFLDENQRKNSQKKGFRNKKVQLVSNNKQ